MTELNILGTWKFLNHTFHLSSNFARFSASECWFKDPPSCSSVHKGKKPFKCVVCDYSCAKNSNRKRPMPSVLEGKKPFKCEVCDYSCAKNSNMKRHKVCSSLIWLKGHEIYSFFI